MFERPHRALYAAFDRFPTRKGAAIHIGRFASTLFDELDGGLLFVLGGPTLPRHQLEGTIEIARVQPEGNYLQRALAFGEALSTSVRALDRSLEIVHVRDPWSAAPVALRRRRYAVIYEVNALPSIELPYHYPALGPRTLAKIRAMELACLDAADLVITPSQTTANLLESLGVAPAKLSVIPNGAELDESRARPVDAPDDYLLYFGSAQSWQGIDDLLRAFARLADYSALRLVIIASEPSKRWKRAEKLAAKLGVAERLLWKFSLEEHELSAWRQHAVASAAPLTDTARNVRQGCAPLKILESMASGVAVVASDVPPVRELITDRVDGWLIHPERPAELARAFRLLLDHRDLAHELGAAARRTIEQRFSWHASLQSLRDHYRRWKGVTPHDEVLASAQVAL